MKRKTIDIEGFSHGDQPVPAAARIGSTLVTGGIFGLFNFARDLEDDPA